MSFFKYLISLSTFFGVSSTQAQSFHLEADCSVNRTDPNGTASKALVSNKKLTLEIGAGEAEAQTIGTFEGVEFRMASPLTISAPYVLIQGKTSKQSVHAGRDIGGTNANLLTLAMQSEHGSLLSTVCNISIQ